MNIPIIRPLGNLLVSSFLFLLIPFLFGYYFIPDFLSIENIILLYSFSFLVPILFISEFNFYTSMIATPPLSVPANIVISALSFFFLLFLGNVDASLQRSYFFFYLINCIAFYTIYKLFKANLFSCFLKSNNLNENTEMFNKIETLLAHKLFFNKYKKQRVYFTYFKFIKILSIVIAFSSLFYYSYLLYNSHLSYFLFVLVPFLSLISYFLIKKLLLIIYFLITPLRIIFNTFFEDPNNYYYDCNGIAVFEEGNIKTVESKYKKLFKPILVYKGKKIDVSDSLWNSFKDSQYSNFLSFLKAKDYLKKLEKLKRIDDF